MSDPNGSVETTEGSSDALQNISPGFSEDEHNMAVETEAEGGVEGNLALISEHFSESESVDDSIDDAEDDDFYDAGEAFADDGGYDDFDSGGDSGF